VKRRFDITAAIWLTPRLFASLDLNLCLSENFEQDENKLDSLNIMNRPPGASNAGMVRGLMNLARALGNLNSVALDWDAKRHGDSDCWPDDVNISGLVRVRFSRVDILYPFPGRDIVQPLGCGSASASVQIVGHRFARHCRSLLLRCTENVIVFQICGLGSKTTTTSIHPHNIWRMSQSTSGPGW
jgi:hypothetical protein